MIYTINLSKISLPGTGCTNPKIDWQPASCADITCIRKDSREIVLDIPDDCVDRCVYVIVDCRDECGLCEPQYLRVCPCVSPEDCPDCHECVDNICVSTCPDGWPCKDGRCVECDDMTPCPDGKVCNNGRCVCPPDKPFSDGRGNCSDCNDANPCPPCFVCTPEGCKPVACQVGVCDPLTGECVQCNTVSDCGPGECCNNGLCDCCPGSRRDPISGACVPSICNRDGDCPHCYTCAVGIGCIPRPCPEGFINIGSGVCCVRECNCDAPNCPGLENCLPTSQYATIPGADTCFCAPCFGPCEGNGDCGPGCYCDGTQCRVNPCQGRCVTGADCGPGCGCSSNGECIPCASLSCTSTDCSQTNGCRCDGAGNCVSSPCSGPCAGSGDCGPGCGCQDFQCVDCASLPEGACRSVAGCDWGPDGCGPSPCDGPCAGGADCGPGCGCLFGGCVTCAQYPCQNNAQCPNGCRCGDNGVCEDNPCAAVRCDEHPDCGFGCRCAPGGFCEPCPPNDPLCGGNYPCLDSSRLTLTGCELTAEYTTQGCCECDPISMGVDVIAYNAGSKTFSVSLALRNGEADTWAAFNSLLPLTGNDLPIAGSVRVTLVVDGVEKHRTVNFTGTSGPIVADFTDVEAPQIGTQLYVQGIGNGQVWLGNTCKYETPPSQVFNRANFINIAAQDWARVLPKAPGADCRAPKFRWYRGSNVNNMSLVAERVSTPFGPFGGNYRDTLSRGNDPFFEYGYFYAFESDCGCNKERKFYSCQGPNGVATRLAPCVFSPETPTIVMGSCGGSVTFTDGVAFDCSLLSGAVPLSPPEFEVLINGAIAGTYTWAGGFAVQPGTSIAVSDPVTTLRVRLKNAPCPCFRDYPVEDAGQFRLSAVLQAGSGCGASDMRVRLIPYAVGAPALPYSVTAELNGNPVALVNSGPFFTSDFVVEIAAAAAGSYVFEVTNATGCTVESSPIVYAPVLTNPFTFEKNCVFDVNLPQLPPTMSITVYNAGTNPASVTLDGSLLTGNVPAGGSRTWAALPANDGILPIVIEDTVDNTCQLVGTVNSACCWIDPYTEVTWVTSGIDHNQGTFDAQITFKNTNGFHTNRFGLSPSPGRTSVAIQDQNGDALHTLAPGAQISKSYIGLSLYANYSAFSQWSSWPPSDTCLRDMPMPNPLCASFQNVFSSQGVVGVQPTPDNSGTSVTVATLCWPNSPNTPPQVFVYNSTALNLSVFRNNVFLAAVSPFSWTPNLGTLIDNRGTHQWRFEDQQNPACSRTHTTVVDCGGAPDPGDFCDDLEGRILTNFGANNFTPGCAGMCPEGAQICLTMCCGYNNINPSIPSLVMYNFSNASVTVRRNSDNALLVSAGPNQTFSVSGTVFSANGTLDLKIQVVDGDTTCEYVKTITWGCAL